jgi:type VI protein secretion system component Hcp
MSTASTTTTRRSRLGLRRALGLGVLASTLGLAASQMATDGRAEALAVTGTAIIVDPASSGVKGKFNIGSFATGVESTGTFKAGDPIGKASFSAVRITRSVDALSPQFLKALATGTPIGRIDVARANATYRFTTVFVTKIDVAGQAEDVETIEMIYGQVQVDSGNVRTCWSQLTNSECVPTLS